jgi:aerobic-type carbon monoxide dehydrogenase small subunit (CoxS/CutS family)
MPYLLDVNGSRRAVHARSGTSLLAVLRDELGLTGAKFGCGRGQCGSCYVMVDGRATASCLLPIEEAAGRAIVTIEGLARDGRLHPIQEAFIAEDAMQCGYCTAGMVVSAVALLAETPHPSDAEIRQALAPNLCRCGVYQRAIRAVRRASR